MDKNKRLEFFARGLVGGLLLGMVAFVVVMRTRSLMEVVELHGVISESGGWTPGDLTAKAGEPLRLRLISDDVMHGFAVGQQDWPAIDMKPGQPVETELVFDQPGRYTFYCTRWCGPNHWRMRGVIEVAGETSAPSSSPPPPLYVTLGLNLDTSHPATNIPSRKPEAGKAATLADQIPDKYLSRDYYRTHSPSEAWTELRADNNQLSDEEIWNLIALIWSRQVTEEMLKEGASLYSANCAACHGEGGAGDGVMAEQLTEPGVTMSETAQPESSIMEHQGKAQATLGITGHTTTSPADFTDPASMLGASPALLQGKIVRGGMGTGMPYWGPIFTDNQIWSLVAYLWTFQFTYP